MTEEIRDHEEHAEAPESLEEVVVRELFDGLESLEFQQEFLQKINSCAVQGEDWQKLVDEIVANKPDAEGTK
jgi:hypothetical protein